MSMGSCSVVAIIPKGFGGRVHRPFMHGGHIGAAERKTCIFYAAHAFIQCVFKT